jgi:hypothetical protein
MVGNILRILAWQKIKVAYSCLEMGGRSNSERVIAYFEQEELLGEYKAATAITRKFYNGLS